MRMFLGVMLGTGTVCAFAAPPPGYLLADRSADGTYFVYVNPATIEEKDVSSFDAPDAPQTSMVLFDRADEQKPQGKNPGGWQFNKLGVKCDKQVIFRITPSSNGERLIYSSPEIVMTGTIDKSVVDLVCANAREKKASDAAWDAVEHAVKSDDKK